MASDTTDSDTKSCPNCGHENVPHAQFCARCGHALDSDPDKVATEVDETQATSTYEPIGSPGAEATWDEPETERTTALPVADAVWSPAAPHGAAPDPVPVATRHRESPRGFILGALATLIILVVLGYYIFAAWFSQSLQDDIAAWMPW